MRRGGLLVGILAAAVAALALTARCVMEDAPDGGGAAADVESSAARTSSVAPARTGTTAPGVRRPGVSRTRRTTSAGDRGERGSSAAGPDDAAPTSSSTAPAEPAAGGATTARDAAGEPVGRFRVFRDPRPGGGGEVGAFALGEGLAVAQWAGGEAGAGLEIYERRGDAWAATAWLPDEVPERRWQPDVADAFVLGDRIVTLGNLDLTAKTRRLRSRRRDGSDAWLPEAEATIPETSSSWHAAGDALLRWDGRTAEFWTVAGAYWTARREGVRAEGWSSGSFAGSSLAYPRGAGWALVTFGDAGPREETVTTPRGGRGLLVRGGAALVLWESRRGVWIHERAGDDAWPRTVTGRRDVAPDDSALRSPAAGDGDLVLLGGVRPGEDVQVFHRADEGWRRTTVPLPPELRSGDRRNTATVSAALRGRQGMLAVTRARGESAVAFFEITDEDLAGAKPLAGDE